MTTIANRTVSPLPTIDSVRAPSAPVLDQATIDHYLRRGRQERARAFSEMIRSIFSSPEPTVASRPSAELHALPARPRNRAGDHAEHADRAA